jgi:hypothetical protein
MNNVLTFEDIDVPKWLPVVDQIYTADSVSSLAKTHKVDEAHIVDFGDRLRMSGAVYLDMKDRSCNLHHRRSRAKTLAKVANDARQLQSSINALDPHAAELFWQPTKFKPFERATASKQTDRFGRTVRLIDRLDGSRAPIYLRPEDIMEAATVVANLADRALEVVTSALKPGLTYSPLGHWVANMHDVWTDLLGKKFTFSAADGVGRSRAFRFCKEAMGLLDPTVKESELQTTVREERDRR